MPSDSTPLRTALADVARTLTHAGIASAGADARLLVAHVLGVPLGRLPLVDALDTEATERLDALVARRVAREPLQHVVGSAPFGPIDLVVGPGVFVPRPETELVLDRATRALAGIASPVVLDLCTGSGALALALAHLRPDARVTAVEKDTEAARWTDRNRDLRARAGDTPIALVRGDVTDPALLADLDGRVDLIVANPPYVPLGTALDPEVADHDPPVALFAGADGLDVVAGMARNLVRWLRPGGVVAIEHDDTNGDGVRAILAATDAFESIEAHRDLANRPRFVTARRTPRR